jgi:hypothetical protein
MENLCREEHDKNPIAAESDGPAVAAGLRREAKAAGSRLLIMISDRLG